jgi:acyl-CoA thioester hydrolase
MTFPAPHLSTPLKVKDEWIDYNGHFNMAYYNVLFDDAGDQLFTSLGLGAEYVKKTNCSFFTLEAHLTYLRELHAGDVVTIENQLLDFDSKRVHYVQRMMHKYEGWESCVSEIIVSHVDLTQKKTSAYPDYILNHIAAAAAAHKSLPRPKQVGHVIGIPRKK